MSYRVLLPQPILPEGYAYLRDHGYEVVDGRGFTEEDIIADIPDCDAMIVRTAKITGKILDAAPKLKIIARHGAGYDNVDLEGARRNKVLVTTAGGANATSVAELAIFYMLYCSRRFKAVMAHCKEDYRYAKMGIQKTELEGKTLGLIGTGNIGKLVAKKAAYGFDMKVLAYDPFAREVPEYIQLVEDRDVVFKESDYVSLHVPATKETTHSVSDLNNPLLAMENVLVAPHIGGATREASTRSSLACAQAVDDYFSGRTPKFIVPELRDLA